MALAPTALPTTVTSTVAEAIVRTPRQGAISTGKPAQALTRAVVATRAMTRAIPRALHLEAQRSGIPWMAHARAVHTPSVLGALVVAPFRRARGALVGEIALA